MNEKPLHACAAVAAVIVFGFTSATSATTGLDARFSSKIPSYYQHLDFNLTSPSAYATAVGGYANPAVYAMMPGAELEYYFTDGEYTSFDGIDRWGLFLGLEGLGFGAVHQRVRDADGAPMYSVTDYRLALSVGSRDHTFGLALGWSGGDTDQLGRSTTIQLGNVHRIGRYVSVGLAGIFSTETDDQSGLADLAVRPIGDKRVTVFGDFELPRGASIDNAPWSLGAMVEPIDGVRVVGRYFEDESYAVSLAYTFGGGLNDGHLRGSAGPRFDKNGDHAYTNYGVRIGYPERNLLGSYFQRDRYYLNMNLQGRVVDTRYRFLDTGRTLTDILQSLEDARLDPRVSGVALNLSGAKMSGGSAWEIREKLTQIQEAGKHVVVFIDEGGMTTYYLASIADRVVMDPEGILVLPGYVMGRTFFANMLEKLGLGFDEWRFLKYKSAAEVLSRHSMSDADREQRMGLVDEYYETVRNAVTSSRGVNNATFDRWIDEITLFSPQKAMDEGLVDRLGSWEDVKEAIRDLEGSRKRYAGARSLGRKFYPSQNWGEPPRIALVYAIGECAMDTGIRARRLERIFQRLRNDRRVKAVVFRVNSPGGSGMASDVVARAMKSCAERKPVVVSQADVAASGGYWISMNADEIVAQPTTITGSIGVIGGWLWDDGIGEKLGMEGDFVQRGDRADLFFGLRFPFVGLSVPYRPLSDEERKLVISEMELFYDGFVRKVAEGRGMTEEEVERVAQGRVWSGVAGKSVGLVDRIGGLKTAIDVARERAGIGQGKEVLVVEYTAKGLFNLEALKREIMPFLGKGENNVVDGSPAIDFLSQYDVFYLRKILEHNGRPLFLLPPEYMPLPAKLR